MKTTRIRPKCNGNDIIVVPGKAGAYCIGNNIQVGWTNISAIMVSRYVCCDCGYSEEWIRHEDIETLKNRYQK